MLLLVSPQVRHKLELRALTLMPFVGSPFCKSKSGHSARERHGQDVEASPQLQLSRRTSHLFHQLNRGGSDVLDTSAESPHNAYQGAEECDLADNMGIFSPENEDNQQATTIARTISFADYPGKEANEDSRVLYIPAPRERDNSMF